MSQLSPSPSRYWGQAVIHRKIKRCRVGVIPEKLEFLRIHPKGLSFGTVDIWLPIPQMFYCGCLQPLVVVGEGVWSDLLAGKCHKI